jgi:hypothetical protein
MNIREIYQIYQTPKNLQEHMLRVAALAQIITENWRAWIDGNAVVRACLLHDIAKPMMFDISKQAQFGMAVDDIAKLYQLQQRLKSRYGEDEYLATLGIAKELGCSQAVLDIIGKVEWRYVPELLKNGNIEGLILIYCDMRIGPYGILPIHERIRECHARTHNYLLDTYLHYGSLVEPDIVKQFHGDILSVTDQDLNSRFENLLNLAV